MLLDVSSDTLGIVVLQLPVSLLLVLRNTNQHLLQQVRIYVADQVADQVATQLLDSGVTVLPTVAVLCGGERTLLQDHAWRRVFHVIGAIETILNNVLEGCGTTVVLLLPSRLAADLSLTTNLVHLDPQATDTPVMAATRAHFAANTTQPVEVTQAVPTFPDPGVPAKRYGELGEYSRYDLMLCWAWLPPLSRLE
eukprot:TRINITY_DN12011_c0_g1_i5.p1 TRINITY_DN12011_c0_g1~~TRINITY_DN12011_c0_g1_i5.p1  ORF type:complete len:195 (+),score=31.95 TRINITY_DN12011_c0_g1_i5:817-1401(+)